MDGNYKYRVHYGEACETVTARSPDEALEIVRNDYEAEWGEGASYQQYDIEIEEAQPDSPAI
jgi:hypothetical protein